MTSPASSGERMVVIARVAAQCDECLVGGDPEPLGEDSLGLLDDDAAVQRQLQLPGHDLLLAHGAFLQDADGGHVHQGGGRHHYRRVQSVRRGPEQVQRPDDLVAQPHRDGVHPGIAHLQRGGGEPRPSRCGAVGADVADDDGLPGAVAVQARSLVVLDLEQLHDPGLLGRGRHQPQRAPAVGQQQPGRVHLQQLDAPVGERLQELHQVIPGDQGVRQFHERLCQALIHRCCHNRQDSPSGRRPDAVMVPRAGGARIRIGVEPQQPADHVARDIVQRRAWRRTRAPAAARVPPPG